MIFNEDFMTGLDAREIRGVKLALTSPPYFTARNYGGKALFKDPQEWKEWCVDAIVKITKTLAEDGVIWWNTANGYQDNKSITSVYNMIIELEKFGIYLIDDIPWLKTAFLPKKFKNRPFPAWEHNFIFSANPKNVEFYRDNVRRPYSPATINRMKYKLARLQSDKDGGFNGEIIDKVKPNPGGATPPNYLLLSPDTSKRPHPAPMSPALANWAIRAYTQPGDLVLDPMSGCGTTAVECAKLGRNFVGFELFQEYIEITNLSLERYQNGLDPYNGLKKAWEEKCQNTLS